MSSSSVFKELMLSRLCRQQSILPEIFFSIKHEFSERRARIVQRRVQRIERREQEHGDQRDGTSILSSLFNFQPIWLPQTDNDNDNDHSYSQLPVNKALTYPEGLSACSLAHPLSGDDVCIMQETFVLVPGWRRRFAQCRKINETKCSAQISCRLE